VAVVKKEAAAGVVVASWEVSVLAVAAAAGVSPAA